MVLVSKELELRARDPRSATAPPNTGRQVMSIEQAGMANAITSSPSTQAARAMAAPCGRYELDLTIMTRRMDASRTARNTKNSSATQRSQLRQRRRKADSRSDRPRGGPGDDWGPERCRWSCDSRSRARLEREAVALLILEHRPPAKALLDRWLREFDAAGVKLPVRLG